MTDKNANLGSMSSIFEVMLATAMRDLLEGTPLQWNCSTSSLNAYSSTTLILFVSHSWKHFLSLLTPCCEDVGISEGLVEAWNKKINDKLTACKDKSSAEILFRHKYSKIYEGQNRSWFHVTVKIEKINEFVKKQCINLPIAFGNKKKP